MIERSSCRYNQVVGIYYFASFSPVVTIRLFFAIAAGKFHPIHQLDYNALLRGHLNEEIYMSPPEGF